MTCICTTGSLLLLLLVSSSTTKTATTASTPSSSLLRPAATHLRSKEQEDALDQEGASACLSSSCYVGDTSSFTTDCHEAFVAEIESLRDYFESFEEQGDTSLSFSKPIKRLLQTCVHTVRLMVHRTLAGTPRNLTNNNFALKIWSKIRDLPGVSLVQYEPS